MINSITALRHQNNSVNMLRLHPEIAYIFLIGGYGCGKSFTDVIVLLTLIGEYMYSETPINVGVLGVTIKLLRRTVIADLLRYMDLSGISYQHNSQAGYIQVGNVTLTYLQMQNPDDIYAFNFNCALVDELDELDSEKVPLVMKAIQERCRKMMPASKHFPKRSSFVFFSTTAQGLGGTYHLIKQFDKANALAKSQGQALPLPYAIIRAKTEDNPHNDPKQIERLRALYTPEEAAAYLDGKFMNLANGRVWYSFDRRKNVCMRFPIQPTEQIYVGQDFNCIAQGTLIATDNGLVAIENIDSSYKVLTRMGYKKVLALLDKGEQECEKYNNLIATPDHVAITEGGDICLQKAKSLLTIPLPALKRAAEAEQLLCFLENAIRSAISTSEHNLWTSPIRCYTELSTNISKGLYQKDMRYIISTVIHWITGWKTSPQSLGKRIEDFITEMSRQRITQMKQEGYTEWLVKVRGLQEIIAYINHVQSADTNTSPLQLPACIAPNVDKLLEDGIITTDYLTKTVGLVNVLVLNAVSLLRELSALSTALSMQSTGNVKHGEKSITNVYDLMIEDTHEFFANGVLVHNCGINASVEFIVREDKMYVVASHHWNDMGEAAIRLRQYYPTNPIMLLPDASGKEIMQGFISQFEEQHIDIHWNNKNPSITERVMAGNMMFRTGRLFVMAPEPDEELKKTDVENVIMTLETHDIDEKTGKPRKGVGIKAPDHVSDSLGYGIWRVIYNIQGYDDILEAIRGPSRHSMNDDDLL